MTELERQILDIIQDAFPLEERPYLAIAATLNERFGRKGVANCVLEQVVFDGVESLRNSGVIRRIGGVYDSKRLGIVSRLCAGKLPMDAVDQFAAAAKEIPAITHNYLRSHEYNVWFTVMGESVEFIQSVLNKLCAETKLYDVHALSATKMFKINTVMKRGNGASEKVGGPGRNTVSAKTAPFEAAFANIAPETPLPLTPADKIRIHLACGDLPHTLTPFADAGLDCVSLQKDLEQKRMRRFGAILRHQEAGFAFNAMVCFDMNSSKMEVESAGRLLAQTPYVSHCYERSAFEGFPYNLYAMVHAQTESELQQYVDEAAQIIGNPDYAVLHSMQELKKTSYRYFG